MMGKVHFTLFIVLFITIGFSCIFAWIFNSSTYYETQPQLLHAQASQGRVEITLPSSTCLVEKFWQEMNGTTPLSEERLNLIRSCHAFLYTRTHKCGSRGVGEVFEGLANVSHQLVTKPYIKHLKYRESPVIVSRHLVYNNYSRLGPNDEIALLNVIRHPIDHLISVYSFRRFHSQLREDKSTFANAKQRSEQNLMTLDQCLEKHGLTSPCYVDNYSALAYMCGRHPHCSPLYPVKRLQIAKYVLDSKYLLVGITEELQEFMEVLETLVPNIFTGALDIYKQQREQSLLNWQTITKFNLTEASRRFVEKADRQAFEFYHFAQAKFHTILEKARAYKRENV